MEKIYWNKLDGLGITKAFTNKGYKTKVFVNDGFDTTSGYNVNSITCIRRKIYDLHNIMLQYAYFNKQDMEFYVHNKDMLLIACSQSKTSEEENDIIEKELIAFGKKLANHLNIDFFSYDIESTVENSELRLKCYECNSLINNYPYSEERLLNYKLEVDEYRANKTNTENLTRYERGVINGTITRITGKFEAEIRAQIYCAECIKRIKQGYINWLIKFREEWRVKDKQIK